MHEYSLLDKISHVSTSLKCKKAVLDEGQILINSKICHTISNIMQSNLTVRKSVYKLLWAYYNNLSFTSIKH